MKSYTFLKYTFKQASDKANNNKKNLNGKLNLILTRTEVSANAKVTRR